MSSISSVLIRRGTELISARLRDHEKSLLDLDGWLGLSIVIFTAVAFGFAIVWVDYTCIRVIATLAAVEDSNPKTYVRLDSEDSNDSFDPDDPEVAAASTAKPITSGLRSAIKHLRTRGGIWSCFRGFRMYLAFTGSDLGAGLLIRFIASMLFATWQMAWVHLVIAEKSPRSSYRRMLGLRHWPRIAPAAALYNFLMCAAFSLPMASAGPAGWTAMIAVTNGGYKELLRVLAINALPTDDPIVPFDRHFGGKVKPEIVGGSGKLSLRDAWTTFDWPARTRFVKVLLKALVIEVALGVVGVRLIMGELALIE
ncbi:hypothetical protein Aspvir_003461 [Aspergillus viridinutans]|uniref:Uncharacterized protein n=1 Tax=Aspergillus viridinutans TaxID=75553 RepID=A0A9P3C562_ASPVI|nr:uncharacterized protein Aspvir_003461 [Aspergillus viridinutans]GIK07792.1 hypothetical protein Aspvir_003461 [Aspergillus viridinutans]